MIWRAFNRRMKKKNINEQPNEKSQFCLLIYASDKTYVNVDRLNFANKFVNWERIAGGTISNGEKTMSDAKGCGCMNRVFRVIWPRFTERKWANKMNDRHKMARIHVKPCSSSNLQISQAMFLFATHIPTRHRLCTCLYSDRSLLSILSVPIQR